MFSAVGILEKTELNRCLQDSSFQILIDLCNYKARIFLFQRSQLLLKFFRNNCMRYYTVSVILFIYQQAYSCRNTLSRGIYGKNSNFCCYFFLTHSKVSFFENCQVLLNDMFCSVFHVILVYSIAKMLSFMREDIDIHWTW